MEAEQQAPAHRRQQQLAEPEPAEASLPGEHTQEEQPWALQLAGRHPLFEREQLPTDSDEDVAAGQAGGEAVIPSPGGAFEPAEQGSPPQPRLPASPACGHQPGGNAATAQAEPAAAARGQGEHAAVQALQDPAAPAEQVAATAASHEAASAGSQPAEPAPAVSLRDAAAVSAQVPASGLPAAAAVADGATAAGAGRAAPAAAAAAVGAGAWSVAEDRLLLRTLLLAGGQLTAERLAKLTDEVGGEAAGRTAEAVGERCLQLMQRYQQKQRQKREAAEAAAAVGAEPAERQ